MTEFGTGPVVSFGPSEEAWQGFRHTLLDVISRNSLKRVCEVGGGANPAIDLADVTRLGLDYTVLDISADELAKTPKGYRTLVGDIVKSEMDGDQFDFVFSKMLAEHVTDARRFHRSVRHILAPGGFAFHFFPTLYTFPFAVNRVTPERLGGALLQMFNPRDSFRRAKFPAYYDWCRGPTNAQIERFVDIGYEVIAYRGFFGHDYYRRVPGVRAMHARMSARLVNHPIPALTSYAYLLLKKPAA